MSEKINFECEHAKAHSGDDVVRMTVTMPNGCQAIAAMDVAGYSAPKALRELADWIETRKNE